MQKVLFILLFSPLFITAQSIIITGKAEGRVFEQVRVKVYADQFSHLKKTIAGTTTDEQGNFSLTLDYSKTNYALLSVELLEGEFYLKPGAEFSFDVFPDTATKGSVYDQLPLQFKIKADDGGLNDNLGRFNAMYNRFVINNFDEIYRSRSLTVIDDFRKTVETTFAGYKDNYFDNYVNYTVAQLEWVSKKKSTNSIVEKYFIGKPVLYQNIQYTDFFKSIFKEFIVKSFYAKYFNRLMEAVHKGSFSVIEQIMLQDELLSKDTAVRELVLMQMVAGFYNNPNFSGKGILTILRKIQEHGNNALLHSIAANYITKLTHMAHGTVAPDFQLPVSSGKILSPNDFRGSVVIYDFMKSDCKVCLAHLDFLQDMMSRMGNKLRLVFFAYGPHPEKISFLLKQRGLDWTVLYVGKRVDILDAYDVKIFPTYIILNPDATIGLAPASMADENLENEVQRIISKNNDKVGE